MNYHESRPSAPTERQLAHLRESGRMSEEEAAALGSAKTDAARESILRRVRARHVASRLDAAVTSGEISIDAAESLIDEVRQGDHSSNLRRRIAEIARRTSPGKDGT